MQELKEVYCDWNKEWTKKMSILTDFLNEDANAIHEIWVYMINENVNFKYGFKGTLQECIDTINNNINL